MPHLLDLPREIRDLIYGAVLENVSCIPSRPKKDPETYIDDSIQVTPGLIIKYDWVRLLRVNRQINCEITERLRSSGIVYKADCLISTDHVLSPILVSVPLPTIYIPRLDLDIRVERRDPKQWTIEELIELHINLLVGLYRLLLGLVVHGQPMPSVWKDSNRSRKTGIWRSEMFPAEEMMAKVHIGNVILNVVSPEGVVEWDWWTKALLSYVWTLNQSMLLYVDVLRQAVGAMCIQFDGNAASQIKII